MMDLWTYLASAKKPIVMYGMGNGADKILAVCKDYNIEISDFFASDGFVRGHSFHGKTVMTYSQIKEKYSASASVSISAPISASISASVSAPISASVSAPISPYSASQSTGNAGKDSGFIVLMSFSSSRPEVLENVRRISSECEFYLPDVPVAGKNIFNREFVQANTDGIKSAYGLLCDDESKRIYENIIRYKLSGDISYLWKCESDEREVMENILQAKDFEYTADFGAYNGDSIRALSLYSPFLRKVTALEPDRHSYKKLCEYIETERRFTVNAIQAGAWSYDGTLTFDNSGNRNATFETNFGNAKKASDVRVIKPDTLFEAETRLDYIKYDVEGAEKEALTGTGATIKRLRPSLLISSYHRSEDIFSLPILTSELTRNMNYKYYLRRFKGLPAWDANLYAVADR